jgi:hypothetical protein
MSDLSELYDAEKAAYSAMLSARANHRSDAGVVQAAEDAWVGAHRALRAEGSPTAVMVMLQKRGAAGADKVRRAR